MGLQCFSRLLVEEEYSKIDIVYFPFVLGARKKWPQDKILSSKYANHTCAGTYNTLSIPLDNTHMVLALKQYI